METQQGDRWDVIAWRELGSTRYTEELINANRRYVDTQIFEAGVELVLPTVSSGLKEVVPPWKTS